MAVLEVLLAILMLALGALTIRTDLLEGMVYNKHLFLFLMAGAFVDFIYYGIFVRDIAIDFLANLILVVAISMVLFYTHSFAGGDCKLSIMLALLYPARYYVVYSESVYTLFWSIAIAIFYGYIYLLAAAVKSLLQGKNELPKDYVRNFVYAFLKSFLITMLYISLINLIMVILNASGIYINSWMVRFICIGLAWMVGNYHIFRETAACIAVLLLDVVLAVCLHVVPFSISAGNYILVGVLLLCQMTINTNLYEELEIMKLKKGMILSTFSSMLMQGSRVRGLPDISSENLRDRLTEGEIESIKRWGVGNNIERIQIVKKVPFAIFIVLGYATYFIIWSFV